MKKVYQTRLGRCGNCLEAVIASITESNIEDIPDFRETNSENWFLEYQKYFLEKHRWVLLDLPIELGLVPTALAGHHEIYGTSERGDELHATVGFEGKIVHDPYPNSPGIKEVKGYMMFLPLGYSLHHYVAPMFKKPPTS